MIKPNNRKDIKTTSTFKEVTFKGNIRNDIN